MSEKYYGNYVGFVVNSAGYDPENRMRIQIAIPGVNYTLYDDVNSDPKDYEIQSVKNEKSLFNNPSILERLRASLPWAERASPLFGSGTAKHYNPETHLENTDPVRTVGTAPSVDLGEIKGGLNQTQLNTAFDAYLEGSTLTGMPKDGKDFGFKDGSKKEWTNFLTTLAGFESGGKSNTSGDGGKSVGIMQINGADASAYINVNSASANAAKRLGVQNRQYTSEELKANPELNMKIAVVMAEGMYSASGGYVDKKAATGSIDYGDARASNTGLAAYWNPLRPEQTSRGTNLGGRKSVFAPKMDKNANFFAVASKPLDSHPTPAPATPPTANPTGDIPDKLEDSSALASNPNTVIESQGKLASVRTQPISKDLREVLQKSVAGTNVKIEVYSGGQDETGPNRTGSDRHDNGQSADVRFFVEENGKRRNLEFTNSADLPILQGIVTNARAAGATGIGAGPGYMGNDGFHIGFGEPAVWGAGGKSANAPDWLKTAYNKGAEGAVDVSKIASTSSLRKDDSNPVWPDEALSSTPASYASGVGTGKGMFSAPEIGAKVWVFFYGGDVQKPVYFSIAHNYDDVSSISQTA